MRLYWLIWFVVTFVIGFLPAEIYCLIKRNGGTLSETIWWLEGWKPGMSNSAFDNPAHMTAGHILVGGVCTLLLVWLIGHFALHWWH